MTAGSEARLGGETGTWLGYKYTGGGISMHRLGRQIVAQ